jgi:hypothetical protein
MVFIGGDQSDARHVSTSSKIDGSTSAERGWSLYGAPWLQPVAISGKSTGTRNRENKRHPLPPAATGCVGKYMVRRGSTVRVRQRALCKSPVYVAGNLGLLPYHLGLPGQPPAFSGIDVGLVRDGQIAQLYTMLTAENRPSSSEE